MLILTIAILLIVAAVSFFYFSYNEAGSISFEWLGESGTLPLSWIPYMVGFLILLLLAAWLLSFVFSIPKRLRRSGQIRGLNKSRDSLDRGLMEISSGDLIAGESSLTSYLEGTPADAAKYITAARSALSRGAEEQAEHYLKRAGDVSNKAGEAVRLTQAEMFLRQGNFQDAETLLTNLNKNKPRNPQILQRLASALQGTGNAQKLAEVTRTMRAKTQIPKDIIAGFEKAAWTKLIADASDSELVNSFELLPKDARRDEDVVASYALRLGDIDQHDRAISTIQHALNGNWSEKLIDVYGRVAPGDSSKQLDQATSWLAKQPKSPALALAIGRLASSKQLWGKAKDSLIKAAQMNLSPEVCTELGDVLNAMGDSKNARDCYQSAAFLATGKSPVGALRDIDTLADELMS